MKDTWLVKSAKNLGGVISKNSPTILTSLAVGGVITTTIFAMRAAPKAICLIEQREEELTDNQEGVSHQPIKLTKIEIIKLTWKVYIPTVCVGAVTIACIIGSNSINQRRNAALATVYGITEAAFREYKDKVVETIGQTKEQKVRDDISADKVKQHALGENEVIFTGKGETLCFDSYSGRYFKSDIEKIRRSVNEINELRLEDSWVSLNDFYFELGLGNTKLGEILGWDLDSGNLKISFSSQLSEEGEPCLVLNYDVEPRYLK